MDAPIQRDILVYILRDQRRGERGLAQVSTQLLAEKLEREHGHQSVTQVRTLLSYLIDKGLVHFQQQMGGFQIVLCSLTPKGLEFLGEQGVDVDALGEEPEEPAAAASSDGVSDVGPEMRAAVQAIEGAEIAEEIREELLGAIELLVEQGAAPPGPRRRGRVRVALRSLQELGAESGLEVVLQLLADLEPWVNPLVNA